MSTIVPMTHNRTPLLVLPFELIAAFWAILRRRALLIRCLIPYLIGICSFVLFMVLFIGYRDFLASTIVGEPGWLFTFTKWGLVFVNIFTSALLAVLAIYIFGSFFLENFVEYLLIEQNLLENASVSIRSILRSCLRGLLDSTMVMLCLLLLGVFTLVLSFIPLLYVIPLILGGFSLGYNIVDLPLSLLEVPFRRRIKMAWSHKSEITVIGLLFSAIMLIPFAGILMLPPVTYVGVQRIARWPELKDLKKFI